MKKSSLFLSFMFLAFAVYSQTGIGTKNVDPSALMELKSTNKGFLPPRVQLQSSTDITTVPAPATGLTVYHTGIAGMAAGLYVNLGTATSATWVNASGGSWNTTGNAGINAATNFIGTTNSVDFVTRTNNTEKMRITAAGNLGIGTATPNAPLQFANATANRKIVLYDGNNNDHQFFGLGLNNFIQRYQVPDVSSNHVFYAGTSATTSNELMRIQGNGNVGIGTTSPGQMLSVSDQVNTSSVATVSFLQPNLGVGNGNYIKLGRALANNDAADIAFFNQGTGSANNYLSLGFSGNPAAVATFKANGNVGIGTTAPAQTLHVQGTARITGSASIATAIMGRDANGDISNFALGTGLSIAAGTLSANSITGNAGGLTDLMRIGLSNCGSFCSQGTARSLVFYNSNGNGEFFGSLSFVSSADPSQPEGSSMVAIDRNATNNSAGIDFKTRNTTTNVMNSRLTIRSDGKVGIGTATPDQILTVQGSASKSDGSTAWIATSDRRVKKDIRPYTDGLQQVLQINPVFFKYNGKGGIDASTSDQVGIIAQEMQKVAPYTIKETDIKIDESGKGLLQLQKADAIMYMLVNAVKEQQTTINAQQAAIEKLQVELKLLKQMTTKIETDKTTGEKMAKR